MFIFLISLIVIFSIILHEYMHGITAYYLGDYTPKISGRITFNPLAHLDPLFTIVIPITILIISLFTYGSPVIIGAAKPVPINPYNFRNLRRDILFVSIAGSLSNLFLGIIFVVLSKLVSLVFFQKLFILAAFLNILLAVLNLIPIPPLDGAKAMMSILPQRLGGYVYYTKIESYGIFILLALFLFTPFFSIIVYITKAIIFFVGGVEL